MKRTSNVAICLALALSIVLYSTSGLGAAASSHMSHPAPTQMAISAPEIVKTGEEFVVEVMHVIDQDQSRPIEGAEVYLVPRYQPYYTGTGTDEESKAIQPQVIGTTDADGKLAVAVSDAGDFYLTVKQPGFNQAFHPITVWDAEAGTFFRTSKSIYRQGEPVGFSFTNGLGSSITLSRGAPWEISRPDGTVVFSPISIMIIIDLGPGETQTWAWDQTDDEGNPVEPGLYVVNLETSAGNMSAMFCITGLKADKEHQNPDPEMPEHNPFKDVTGEHPWGDPHILSLYERQIIQGKSADMFDPEGSLTRAEFVTLLLRACGIEPLKAQDLAIEAAFETSDSFSKQDIMGRDMVLLPEDGHWAEPYIHTAMGLGIIRPEEYPDGFGPDTPITRMEVCVMAARALGLENETVQNAGALPGFDDYESIPPTYRGYVVKAVEWGVLRGYPDGTFLPGNGATRREAAVIIYRLLELD